MDAFGSFGSRINDPRNIGKPLREVELRASWQVKTIILELGTDETNRYYSAVKYMMMQGLAKILHEDTQFDQHTGTWKSLLSWAVMVEQTQAQIDEGVTAALALLARKEVPNA